MGYPQTHPPGSAPSEKVQAWQAVFPVSRMSSSCQWHPASA